MCLRKWMLWFPKVCTKNVQFSQKLSHLQQKTKSSLPVPDYYIPGPGYKIDFSLVQNAMLWLFRFYLFIYFLHWYPQSASSSLWILKKTSLIFNLFQTEITSLDFLFWPKTWGAVLSDDTITRCFAFYCAAGAKCSLSTCFCKWKVTKSNFFSPL